MQGVLRSRGTVLLSVGGCKKLLQTGWLKQQFLSHSSRGWKSKIRVPVWSGSGEDPLLGLQIAVFLQCPRGLLFPSELSWPLRTSISFMKAPPSPPNHLAKTPPPNTITLGSGFQHMHFGGAQTFSPLQEGRGYFGSLRGQLEKLHREG